LAGAKRHSKIVLMSELNLTVLDYLYDRTDHTSHKIISFDRELRMTSDLTTGHSTSLPGGHRDAVAPAMVPADVHEPSEAALASANVPVTDLKLLVVRFLSHLSPPLPVRRRLDLI
jgi:hypothetical protein